MINRHTPAERQRAYRHTPAERDDAPRHTPAEHASDRLTTAERQALPDSVFGLPERREYPMPDAAHVHAAEAYFRDCPEDLKPRLARAILSRAHVLGVTVQSPTILSYASK